ncbi:MAG: hypothetical protein JSW61_15025 [Candidatus Thorarchaeota archaeon]|nr:MAG: hypothetical protein JSW61_15025 [Candidatus Thorarchaeota archaeon]
MKRVYKVGAVFGVICVVSVGLLVSLQFVALDDFNWHVEIDDTFQFEFESWGNSSLGALSPLEVREILNLNGTIILARVTNLPPLVGPIDSSKFLDRILLETKINCTFVNGTYLMQEIETILCSAISGCILPLGSWSVIESLFPQDVPSWRPNEEHIATRLFEDHLHIEWVWFGSFDSSGGWSGNVSLTTGTPNQVMWRYTHSGTVFIELTLTE